MFHQTRTILGKLKSTLIACGENKMKGLSRIVIVQGLEDSNDSGFTRKE